MESSFKDMVISSVCKQIKSEIRRAYMEPGNIFPNLDNWIITVEHADGKTEFIAIAYEDMLYVFYM